jgi:hypothetical protein
MLFKHISYPLLWQDEAQTVMLGVNTLEYGFPKVHGRRNVIYDNQDVDLTMGVNERFDAFIATPWIQFYFATLGVALADREEDPYAKTARLRLPFAIAGFVGAWMVLLALLRSVPGDWKKKSMLSAAYLALAALSVSFQLHAREARYYPLAALEIGLLVYFHQRWKQQNWRGRALPFADLLTLVLLFHTFVPAFASAASAVAIDTTWSCAGERGRLRLTELARRLWPTFASGLIAIPGVLFYETWDMGRAMSEKFDFSSDVYLMNLRLGFRYLLEYEFLAPALCLLAGRQLCRLQRVEPASGEVAGRATARFFWLLVVTHWLLVARLPWFFSRYLVVLSPIVSGLAILEAALLISELRRTAGGLRWFALLAGLVTLAGSAVVRVPDLRGRYYEITHPYRGPVDAVIERLRERHAEPDRLVIATNYEALVYAYYLDCRVIDTFSRNNLRQDLLLVSLSPRGESAPFPLVG